MHTKNLLYNHARTNRRDEPTGCKTELAGKLDGVSDKNGTKY